MSWPSYRPSVSRVDVAVYCRLTPTGLKPAFSSVRIAAVLTAAGAIVIRPQVTCGQTAMSQRTRAHPTSVGVAEVAHSDHS